MFDKLRSPCISVDNSPAVYINQYQMELVSRSLIIFTDRLILHNEPNKDAGQPFSKQITESLKERRIELRLQSADRTDLFDTLRVLIRNSSYGRESI